jgi:hypothetical protein
MQIEIRLVCPDPNFNKATILDPDLMNPDPKHSNRYVGTATYTVSRDTDQKYSYKN